MKRAICRSRGQYRLRLVPGEGMGGGELPVSVNEEVISEGSVVTLKRHYAHNFWIWNVIGGIQTSGH